MGAESLGKLYMTAFYFVMSTLTTVGYGDISPLSEGGDRVIMLFGILLLLVGVASFAVLAG